MVRKANHSLGMIKRISAFIYKIALISLCSALVRPIKEYDKVILYLLIKRQSAAIGMERGIKLVKEICHFHHEDR